MAYQHIFLLMLFAIFLILSLLHLYWTLGGKWGLDASLPTDEKGEKLLQPGKFETFIVFFVLGLFAVYYLRLTSFIEFSLPHGLVQVISWVIPIIFLIRSIGDFKYVGFFKKHTSSLFAKNDSRYFSPLCLLIAILGFSIQYL